VLAGLPRDGGSGAQHSRLLLCTPRCAGCDALAVHLVLMNVACSLNLPMGWRVLTGCYCVMVPWILAHWEEYHTGAGRDGGAGEQAAVTAG
jgi:hypothetical protein